MVCCVRLYSVVCCPFRLGSVSDLCFRRLWSGEMNVTVVWQQVLCVTVGSSLQDRRMCVRLYHRVRPRCWGGDLSGGDLSSISTTVWSVTPTRCVCVCDSRVCQLSDVGVSVCVRGHGFPHGVDGVGKGSSVCRRLSGCCWLDMELLQGSSINFQ